MESIVVTYAKQVAVGIPLLLVYMAGMVLAVVFWRRSPKACLLCLLGMGLLLATGVVQPLVTLLIIRSMSTQGWTSDRVSVLLGATGIVASIVRAVAMGLLLGAVFSGRRAGWLAGHGAVAPVEEPRSARPTGTGITRPMGGESFSTGG